jgi:hypothetical protein
LSADGCENRTITVDGTSRNVNMLRYTSLSSFHDWQGNNVTVTPRPTTTSTTTPGSGSLMKISFILISFGLILNVFWY